jgi:maltose-binding protein MalE
MPLATTQILQNRYRIVQLLGQGGFGAVYKAWDLNLNRPCAVKENLDTSPDAQRQFNREATILSNLIHGHLARVTDYFFIPNQGQYLVMDFVEGEDLQQILEREGALPEAQVLTWMGQICDALTYLHNQSPPVIHRDIKPANIKINPQGSAILVDFGVAKIWDPSMRTTQGARAITPGFSPFEQYGQAPTDERSDIYALGATAYALLTGRAPVESISRVAGTALPEPHSLRRDISPQVERAILKALEVQPANRFRNATEFKAGLNAPATQPQAVMPARSAVMAQPQVAAPAMPAARSAPGKTGKARWLVPVAVVGVLAVLGIIGIILAVSQGSKKGSADPTEAPIIAEPTRAATQPRAVELTKVMDPTQAVFEGNLTLAVVSQGTDFMQAITDMTGKFTGSYPDVKITIQEFPSDGGWDQIYTMIAAGAAPDIILGEPSNFLKPVQAGQIVDLESLGADMISLAQNYSPMAFESMQMDGKTYALPINENGIAMLYNTAIANGNDFPDDFDNLLKNAKAYGKENPGKYLFCNPGLGKDSPNAYTNAAIYFGFGIPGFIDKTGNVYVDSPEAIQAANWMLDILPYVPPDSSWGTCPNYFLEGKVAGLWYGPWNIQDIENAGIDYAVVPMGKPFISYLSLAISTQAAAEGKGQAALEVVQFLINSDSSLALVRAFGGIPANRDAKKQFLNEKPAMAGFALAYEHGVPLDFNRYLELWWDPMTTADTAILRREKTPAEALAEAQKTMEEAVASMK